MGRRWARYCLAPYSLGQDMSFAICGCKGAFLENRIRRNEKTLSSNFWMAFGACLLTGRQVPRDDFEDFKDAI